MQKLKKKSLVLSAGIGMVVSLILTALLCLGFTAAVVRGWLPMEMLGLWGSIAAGIAVCAATVLVARSRGRQALLTGGVLAGGFLLLAALFCAGGGSKTAFGPWLWQLGCAVLAGGMLGSVMSIRQNTHKKHRRRTC